MGHRAWSQEDVKNVGSVSERSRFKKESHSARESALCAAGLVRKGAGWVATEDVELDDGDWSLNKKFDEVPWPLLRQ